MSELKYKIVVGLEIHVHLCTKTKMFCGCELSYGAVGNSRVCPVCLGMPGVLPVMNKQAFEYSVLTAAALNCGIPNFTKWDRKSYYYPDLPKNYQISQYDLPLSENGFIEIGLEGGETKKIRIIRAHLEEDAGKNIHTAGDFSQVDLNRAGTPLLEIVTEPDMNSAAEVKALATELQRIVRYLGVSAGDMQKGHMRFEPNINLIITRDGKEFKTPIVEVKNLNSFRALEGSVAYEARRQLDEFLATGETMEMGNKTTRGWDDVNEVTVLQRTKEEAHDYRYFPDPDLVGVEMDDEWLAEIKAKLCELPLQKQRRFVDEYKLSDYDAGVLTAERDVAELFDEAVKLGGEPKRVCNIVTQDILRKIKETGKSIRELGFTPQKIKDLAEMIVIGDISASVSTAISDIIVTEEDLTPWEIAKKHNLLQKSDAGELEVILDEVLAANPQAVEDAKGDSKKKAKAFGFLLGQVMQKTKGQANPQVVTEILEKKLKIK